LAAVLVGPVEELENLLGHLGLLLALVHQDEARAGDRPAVLAALVGEQQIETGRFLPVGIGRRCLEALAVGHHRAAILVDEFGIGELVLQRIGVFDIADGAGRPRRQRRDALIALAADARRPLDRGVLADLALELGAHLREIVGENEVGARAVGAVERRDRRRR